MYCSVKFFEPTVIVGPPPPPSSSAPPLSPTLPQAASSSSASAPSIAGMARISFVLVFTLSSSSWLPAALLRDLQAFRGQSSLQRAEADFRDDRQDRHRERAREQDGGVVALGALDYEVPEAAAADERRQSCARDHLHGGGADAREDHRRCYGELYAGKDLAAGEPHAARGVCDVPAHLPQARGG